MIVLMSGEIASGKTSLASRLATQFSAEHVIVRQALASVLGLQLTDRRSLQIHGADLDRRTNGRWLLHYVQERLQDQHFLVVDSLRTRRQTIPLLDELTDSRLLFLRASEQRRRERYSRARLLDAIKGSASFDAAMNHPTEAEVSRLRPLAHLIIETDEMSELEVGKEATNWLQTQLPRCG